MPVWPSHIVRGLLVPRRAVKVAASLAWVIGVLFCAGVSASALKADRLRPTAPRIVGPRTTSSRRPLYSFSATDRETARSRLKYRCGFDTIRLHSCPARFSQQLDQGQHVL